MRALTPEEEAFITEGSNLNKSTPQMSNDDGPIVVTGGGGGPIVVTGGGGGGGGGMPDLGGGGGGGGSTTGGQGSGGWGPEDDAGIEPRCDQADSIKGISPPDGAPYYAPKGVTSGKLNETVEHFRNIALGNDSPLGLLGAHERVLLEFYDVYTNPSNPYFSDFKDWGTSRGPSGGIAGGEITYWSQAVSNYVTASSAFEPFGNFWYGYLGTLASISPDELYFAAAALQEGTSTFADSPEDQPHVEYGIASANAYLASGQTVPTLSVAERPCP